MHEREYTALYNTYADRLFRFCRFMTGTKAAAEDVLQAVFIKIWRGSEPPPDEIERTRWLYAVTRNACLDHIRKERRFSLFRQSLNVTDQTVDTNGDAGDEFFGMIAQLPELERTLLYLHFKAGYSYKEMESIAQVNENTARVRVCRALKKLRELTDKDVL